MTDFSLPGETHVAFVHLKVSDRYSSLAFYQEKLGFRIIQREGDTVSLSASGELPASLYLTQIPGAEPKPARTTGLYHIAIRLPDRTSLGRTIQRLLSYDWRFLGASDHGVSEAFYTTDPDGNGIELYADRPPSQWPWQNGKIAMVSEPLDVSSFINGDANNVSADLPSQTDIGHVHLQVSDLLRARKFYHDLLGLEITQSDYPGALFLAAGNYHHHLGLNIWAGQGASPPPPSAVGLISYGLRIPDERSWSELVQRVKTAGIPVEAAHREPDATSVLVYDPDGIGVALVL
jgi:catechol 2,3-dioxygenase